VSNSDFTNGGSLIFPFPSFAVLKRFDLAQSFWPPDVAAPGEATSKTLHRGAHHPGFHLTSCPLLAVELALNGSWNRPDFSGELRLDAVQVVPVIVSDEIHGETQVPKPSRAPDSVQVSFRGLGEVKVNHHVD